MPHDKPPPFPPSPMRDENDGLVLAIGLLSLLALPLGLLHEWYFFGLVTWALMILTVAVGYGGGRSRGKVLAALLACLLAYWALFSAMTWTDAPQGELQLLLGLPLSTAFLVYGIWPLGAVFGLLYFVMFERAVLPPAKLRKFYADFGRRH